MTFLRLCRLSSGSGGGGGHPTAAAKLQLLLTSPGSCKPPPGGVVSAAETGDTQPLIGRFDPTAPPEPVQSQGSTVVQRKSYAYHNISTPVPLAGTEVLPLIGFVIALKKFQF